MVRQCAWCLHIIDDYGGHVSPVPQPKLYEATHGICYICGMQWLEKVQQDQCSDVIMIGNADDKAGKPWHEPELIAVGRATRRYEA